ncbi:MAG: MaoC/PaaZ C-terminal domain-containing protein, partial [Dehalococcoidales bacterium]|nr:MaoC/PaaZ C-terminal domain-containing protein [Dehalococcoidales bacterium]
LKEQAVTKQLYYEDVAVGSEITPLVKQPTTRQLVMWAGASGDYQPIHYDKDFAQSRGLPGVIVHGQLVGSFLGQLMTDWIGEQGSLRKLSCSYKGMNFPGEALTCRGKVTKKYVEYRQHYVECNLWVENEKGEKTVSGTATVILPARGV